MIRWDYANNHRDVRIWDDSTDFYCPIKYDQSIAEKKGVCYTSFIASDITEDEFNEFINWVNSHNMKIEKLQDFNAIKVAWTTYLDSQYNDPV